MKKSLITTLLLSLGISVSASAADQYIWMEAESGGEMNPIVVKSDMGASQSIYLGSWKWAEYGSRSASNGMITFDVYVPETGDYRLWGRVRLPNTGSRPFDISVGNGNAADSSQWTSWAADNRSNVKSWGWSDSGFTRTLNKGMNTLHLIQREGGPNVHLDKILLTNVASFVPTGLGAPEPSLDITNPYTSSAVGKYGRLRLVGNQLSDKNGQPVQLRGISAHGLQWFPLVDKQTIPNMAEYFGADVVRLAMYIEDFAPTDPSDFWGGYMADRTGMLARKERAIQDAINAGLYVLVDWHIHNAPANYTSEAVEFFSYISRKYGHLPNIIYEICNEPVAVSWSGGIKPYANTVINAIRQNDPHNVIIVGTPNWSQDVDIAARDPLTQSNVMYAFHFYAATHDFNTMKSKVDAALAAGAAIFVSEWGTSDVGTSTSNFSVGKQWMDYMNQRKLSWVNWSLGNKDETSSILKPRAPMAGPWADSDLTEAGKWLKPYFNAPSAGTGSSTSTTSTSSSSSSSSSSSGATSTTSNLVLEGEAAAIRSNVQVVGDAIGYFNGGSHFGFRSVDLNGVTQMIVRYGAGNAGGVAEIRTGSTSGPLLATITASHTGSYSSYQNFTVNLSSVSGVHDLYFVGRSGTGIFDLDKVTLVKSTGSVGSGSSSSSSTSSSSSSSSSGATSSTGNLVLEGEAASIMNNAQSVGDAVGYFNAGSHFGFRSIDMTGVSQVVVRYGTQSNGSVAEIRVGGPSGQLLATINVNNTGSYSNYQDFTVNISSVSGVHDLYIVGRTGNGIFNVDRLTLLRSGAASSGGTATVSGVAGCNDSNSTVLQSSGNVVAGRCYRYNHGSGRLQLGTWNLNGSASYEVRSCNGAVTTANQLLNTYTAVNTPTSNCNHFIFVRSASAGFNLQLGSW